MERTMIISKSVSKVFVHADALAHDIHGTTDGLVPEPAYDDNALEPGMFERLEAALWQAHDELDSDDVAAVVADADEVLLPVIGVEFDAS